MFKIAYISYILAFHKSEGDTSPTHSLISLEGNRSQSVLATTTAFIVFRMCIYNAWHFGFYFLVLLT